MLTPPRRTFGVLPAVLCGVLGATLMAVRLLVPTPVGMADNGDGVRLLCQLGADIDGSERFAFARFVYPAPGPDAACEPYRTSQVLQLRLTSWLTDLFGLPGAVDMHVVIVQDCLLTGLAIGTMAWLLRRSPWWAQVVAAAGLFLVLADATFAGYVASAYSEPAAFTGLVAFALAGVAVVSGERPRTAFLIATAGAALAVSAKIGMVTLAVPFVLFLATRRLPLGRRRTGVASFVLAGLGVVAVGGAATWVYTDEQAGFERVNVANEITIAIMPANGDPARAAADLGLPRSFGRFSGKGWWARDPMHSAPEWPSVRALMTREHVAGYFLDHPGVAARVLGAGGDDYLRFRPDDLGSYGATAGEPPRAQECRLCLLPTVSHAFAWSRFAGVLGYWLACLTGAVVLARRSAAGSPRRGFALVALVLVGCAVVQYLTTVLGDGAEVTRHLVVGLFAASLAPVWLLAALFAARRPKPEPVEPPDETGGEPAAEPVQEADAAIE